MSLPKLPIEPDQEGYELLEGEEALVTPGLVPWARPTVPGQWPRIRCRWTLDRDEFVVMEAFHEANKALPFLADLILESAWPTEHLCRFASGTWRLAVEGEAFYRSAELLVEPTVYVP